MSVQCEDNYNFSVGKIEVETIRRCPPRHKSDGLSPFIVSGCMDKKRISIRISCLMDKQLKKLEKLAVGEVRIINGLPFVYDIFSQIMIVSPVVFRKEVVYGEMLIYADSCSHSIITVLPKIE